MIHYPATQESHHVQIAGFDLDSTLIKTKSGAKFAKHVDDWTWLYPGIEDELQTLHEDGYRVVIFTNQKRMPKYFEEKIKNITKSLPYVETFVATSDDEYRKPNIGMWQPHFQREGSFYVGDAAGRSWDHSDCDRLFAQNLNINFYTPEEYFLYNNTIENQVPTSQHIMCLVGYPGSGKSTFTNIYKDYFTIINQDELKTKEKCIKKLHDELKNGNSCIVDRTNPSVEDRKIWIDIAKKYNIPIICCNILTTIDQAKYLNSKRTHHVPDIVYSVYSKKYKHPSKREGFDEILDIPIKIN